MSSAELVDNPDEIAAVEFRAHAGAAARRRVIAFAAAIVCSSPVFA
jgi:hypothetical protein